MWQPLIEHQPQAAVDSVEASPHLLTLILGWIIRFINAAATRPASGRTTETRKASSFLLALALSNSPTRGWQKRYTPLARRGTFSTGDLLPTAADAGVRHAVPNQREIPRAAACQQM